MLEDLAKTAGFDTLVKERYTKGKAEGLKAKERDMHAGLSKKEAEKERQDSKVVYDSSVLHSGNGGIDSGYGSSLVKDKSIAGMILQPSLMNMPESTSRTKVIDRPTQLRGFKPLYPKI
jgi:hypothetical protein